MQILLIAASSLYNWENTLWVFNDCHTILKYTGNPLHSNWKNTEISTELNVPLLSISNGDIFFQMFLCGFVTKNSFCNYFNSVDYILWRCMKNNGLLSNLCCPYSCLGVVNRLLNDSTWGSFLLSHTALMSFVIVQDPSHHIVTSF